MGASLINENTTELTCETHGGYLKFKNDPNKNCPYCEKDIADLKSTPFFRKTNSFSNSFVTVEVGCVEHGFKSAQVPISLAEKIQNTCEKCSQAYNSGLNMAIKKRIDEELEKANIPLNTRSLSFESLDKSASPKQALICKTLIDDIKQLIKVGTAKQYRNLFITGSMGTGKTAIASIFLKNIIVRSIDSPTKDPNDVIYENKLRCLFTSESQLIQDIKDTWKDSQTSTKRIFNKLSTVPILCIDDVGSIESSTHLFEAYTAIIDERYKRNLPTIMTSNVPHTDLGKVIGSRSADRFLESDKALVINCDWKGYRQRTPVQVL